MCLLCLSLPVLRPVPLLCVFAASSVEGLCLQQMLFCVGTGAASMQRDTLACFGDYSSLGHTIAACPRAGFGWLTPRTCVATVLGVVVCTLPALSKASNSNIVCMFPFLQPSVCRQTFLLGMHPQRLIGGRAWCVLMKIRHMQVCVVCLVPALYFIGPEAPTSAERGFSCWLVLQ